MAGSNGSGDRGLSKDCAHGSNRNCGAASNPATNWRQTLSHTSDSALEASHWPGLPVLYNIRAPGFGLRQYAGTVLLHPHNVRLDLAMLIATLVAGGGAHNARTICCPPDGVRCTRAVRPLGLVVCGQLGSNGAVGAVPARRLPSLEQSQAQQEANGGQN